MQKKKISVPEEVLSVVGALAAAGFSAYPVGGCVRDVLRGAEPKDWDVTTNAKPGEIEKIFPDTFYENKFLTVTVKTGSAHSALAEIEVTTFRIEGKYTDKRHPDEVRPAATLEEDLSRRDFTINAVALEISPSAPGQPKLIDPFGGEKDIAAKIVRAVGDPEERFGEDALRMLRAVRFASELGFSVEEKTAVAIKKLAGNLECIAKERIRDEFMKIIASSRAREGVEMLREFGLLRFIVPELEEGIGVENRPRIFTIWEHNLKALEWGVKAGYAPLIRFTAMLHDAGKPRTKGEMKRGEWTFYGHDVVGAKMAAAIMTRLHFSRDEIEKVATLIRWHLFKYDPEEGITDSSIRRLIRRVGVHNMEDLVRLRICDRMGMGVPKAMPYRLRHFQFRVEKIIREEEEPTPKMLKIRGDEIMRILNIEPGPKIGKIIEVLMQEVIDDPAKNDPAALALRVAQLGKLSDEELVRIANAAETKIELAENERISGIKAKYYVK